MNKFKIFKKLWSAWILFVLPFLADAQNNHPNLVRFEPVDMKRVKQVEAMLTDQPRGFGDPIEERTRWDSLYRTGNFHTLIAEADSISALPFPKLTEAIYMSYFGGKDSETSKRFIMKRRMLLTRMIWAECLTNKGKYMPAIINALNDILHTRTWSFPAEDQRKLNYEGKLYTIGLSSSAYGEDMAQTLYLLGGKLPAPMKQKIYNMLQQRIFQPTLNAVRNKNANAEFISLMDTGNHNSVTLAYVTAAALTVIQDKHQRALFVTIAERYSKNFLLGYLDDGYCTEGIAYYSYGFGHYTFLREALFTATQGEIDLFKNPKVAKMAAFAPAMEIINNMYPAISDCEPNSKPWPQLMHYLNKEFGLGKNEYTAPPAYMEQPALCYLMFYFPNLASGKGNTSIVKATNIRDYFEEAGVLTVRPAAGSSFDVGATLKGGTNAEHHNHNDVGSYTIVAGEELLTGDVGLATYTPKYFGKERYSLFKTTSSYGHNVPLINGVQQHFGENARAVVVAKDFTPDRDVFGMDITSAYKVPSLKRLIRTFTYDRTSNGCMIVKDDFAFSSAGRFETALITRYPWIQTSDNTIEIIGKKERLKVTITASKGKLLISDEVIDEGPAPYTRIAVRLSGAALTGFVSMEFEKL